MATRNVNLTDRLAALIDERVSSGRFQDAGEVVSEGLRLLEQSERDEALKLERLRQAVAIGREDLRQGNTVAIERGGERDYFKRLGQTGAR